jgi:hypothetical protein
MRRGFVREVVVGRRPVPPAQGQGLADDYQPDAVGFVMVVSVATEDRRQSADHSPLELAQMYKAAMGDQVYVFSLRRSSREATARW